MARPFSAAETYDYGHDSSPGEWQALRGELVALLDHVEGQYSRAGAQQPGYDLLAQRMRELRSQVADTPATNRHQEALRSVKRAVDRFSERDEETMFPANPQDVLQSAIHEIRLRQRAPAQQPMAQVAAPPQFDRLASSVTGLSARLERLESEIRAQRDGGDNVKVIGEQVAQLTHVVELLAGAVGETGQVKRLESQIAGLADMISGGRNTDVLALTNRLEDLAGTIDRLARAQDDHHVQDEQHAALSHGMAAIEDNVRTIYDRIDAIEKNSTLAPADFNRLTEDMAAFTAEMRESVGQVRPGQLLARVDALNARLADMESRDGLVGDLHADIDALRSAIVDAFEPRFVAIETQLGTITKSLAAARKPDPSIAQIEAQIRQLVGRMDETGAQLTSLAKLYSQPAGGPAPDFEALASLVAKRTSDAFSNAKSTTPNGLSDETFAELEKRMSKLFVAANKDKAPEDFSDVHDGIRRVDERLDRLEAALSGRKDVAPAPLAAPAPQIAMPVAKAPAGDAMPKNPANEAPLLDKGFGDAGPVRTALDAKAGVAKTRDHMLGAGEPTLTGAMKPVTPEMVGGKSAKPTMEQAPPVKAADTGVPVFDPNSVTRPPRPESSLDRQAREAFAAAPSVAPAMAGAPEIAMQAEGGDQALASSRNTFIEAARRAAQNKTPATQEPASNSLIGRAMARLHSGAEAAPVRSDAVSARAEIAPVVEAPAKAKRVKEPKAAKPAKPVMEKVGAGQQSFLRRHRQPLLLAATLVAVGVLAVNLINQRMAASAPPKASVEEAVTPPEAPTAAPKGDVSALDTKPAAAVRAIPGTGADAIDTLATGSINPMAAMNFTKPMEVAAMPSAIQFAQTAKPAVTLTPLDALDPVETSAVPPSPVKVELPPDTIGPLEMRQAAADGDARAQFEIAAIYTEGRAVTQDYAQAVVWYERSAAQGFAPAQYRLGNLYEGGKGVEKNLEQARLWYQRAAEAGNRMSMHNLAALYAGGTLGKQEFAQAAEWFEQAAMRGMTDSQFNLGMLYARGLGVKQDLEASYKWFSLAAGNGDKDAEKARDDVAKSLDAAAVTRLTAEIGAWKEVAIDLPANFAPIGTWSKAFDAGQAITNKAVVVKVQAALVKLGYDVGTPDGLAGPKTAEAIKSFEKATGMTETGAINPRLLAVLGSQPV